MQFSSSTEKSNSRRDENYGILSENSVILVEISTRIAGFEERICKFSSAQLYGLGGDCRIGDLGDSWNRSSGCTPAQAGVGRYVGSTGYDTKPSINDDQVDVVVGQAHTTSSLA